LNRARRRRSREQDETDGGSEDAEGERAGTQGPIAQLAEEEAGPITWRSVDLPEPDGPAIPTNAPASIETLTSSSATTIWPPVE
jgi:hypothetical protein